MNSDIIYSDDGATLTYFSRSMPSIRCTVPHDSLFVAATTARRWNILQRFADGNWDFGTVCNAARTFARCARMTGGVTRYRGQSEDVEVLTAAHRACAAVMRHPEMTDDSDEDKVITMTSMPPVVTDDEADNVDVKSDDARGRYDR
jgi:hypothetical protein